MTIPTAPQAAEPDEAIAPPPAASPSTDRFFLWVAGLGVARSEGWLGGVAAGIAARLRIDPLIVRGVLVVAALFGLPVIFLYALAWALLPDADGRTHARDLLHRDYQPVQLGILAMAVIGLIPSAPLTGAVFGLGYVNWSALSVLSWVVGLGIVVVLLLLIVRAASRTPGASAQDLPKASADPAAPPVGASFVRPEPPLTPALNDADSVAAWKEQHAAWKEQDQAWRRQQQDAERAVRDQLRHERQAEAAVFAAQATERRRVRRASNPRASFAYVVAVTGLAIVTGAGIGLWGGFGASSGAIGALSAALVLSLGMIAAGIWRRRSGFLAFVTIVTLIGGLIAGAASALPQFTFGWASISNDRATTMTQPFGELFVNLTPYEGAPRPIVITKGTGSTRIDVQAGVQLDLRASLPAGEVSWERTSDETGEITDSGVWEANGTAGVVTHVAADESAVNTRQSVDVTQRGGSIQVVIHEPKKVQE